MIECGALNRLRGTGVVKHFCTLHIVEKSIEIKLVWNHIYGLYLALVFGLLAMNAWAGLAVLISYLIGESKGWGEWIGALTRYDTKDEKWLEKQYKDNEGVGFPYIHQIANSVVKEQVEGGLETKLKQYNKYATLALILRGMFWWGLVYGVLAGFRLISIVEAIVLTVLLGIGFPISCWLGKIVKYEAKFGALEFKRGWENQEIVYGLFQGIALWYVIISSIF